MFTVFFFRFCFKQEEIQDIFPKNFNIVSAVRFGIMHCVDMKAI